MAVALKSDTSDQADWVTYRSQTLAPDIKRPPRYSRRSRPQSRARLAPVHSLPVGPDQAPWLRWLRWVTIGTTWLTAGTVVSTLALYGLSVSLNRQLTETTSQLTQLERHEHRLTTANELLKHHLADQAKRPQAGLMSPHPEHVLFLTPAPQRPTEPPQFQRSSQEGPLFPMGY
ncbi:hypothetical protein XM38_011440 [Halomicronema hongdechloris C2206]|uniref:Cell division protein FtsL n=1 Tax=Halomicronema hongdechloris C2206 TaxID=1641165 RepID=A0A1Z3HIR9_9CYAN|nr:hypothetical protein [Halomicronema hongdechloris]ASC70214.1 hypothetical protein XM38_011440 [Halomicronema hongdechloris C2206]